mgnify:CR=1 FL=1
MKTTKFFTAAIIVSGLTFTACGSDKKENAEAMDSTETEMYQSDLEANNQTETENPAALKPMSCPGGAQVYKAKLHSYRELPIRLAEFGHVFRQEPSGARHGLMRVQAFTQDDAHIFCTEDQIQSEVATFIDLLHEVYADFGFNEIIVKLSTRPESRVGSDEVWDKAEHALEQALNAAELDWDLQPGEGAFYGPKIEFSLKAHFHRISIHQPSIN